MQLRPIKCKTTTTTKKNASGRVRSQIIEHPLRYNLAVKEPRDACLTRLPAPWTRDADAGCDVVAMHSSLSPYRRLQTLTTAPSTSRAEARDCNRSHCRKVRWGTRTTLGHALHTPCKGSVESRDLPRTRSHVIRPFYISRRLDRPSDGADVRRKGRANGRTCQPRATTKADLRVVKGTRRRCEKMCHGIRFMASRHHGQTQRQDGAI